MLSLSYVIHNKNKFPLPYLFKSSEVGKEIQDLVTTVSLDLLVCVASAHDQSPGSEETSP